MNQTLILYQTGFGRIQNSGAFHLDNLVMNVLLVSLNFKTDFTIATNV